MEHTTVGTIVAEDYRAAAIFEKYSIDYCCHGNVTLDEACRKNGLEREKLQSELDALSRTKGQSSDIYDAMELDALADTIVATHHAYVRHALPVISNHLGKVLAKHGTNHAELAQIQVLYSTVAEELTRHMAKEEMVLFPFIKTMVKNSREGTRTQRPHFGSIVHPIRMMETEHSEAGNAFDSIRALTEEFIPPADACPTFRITYQELKDFEADLHKHIHLENNILFPKAIELEKFVLGS